MHIRHLAAAMLVMLCLCAPHAAHTQAFDASCNIASDEEALTQQEIDSVTPFLASVRKFINKVACKPIHAVSNFVNGKKDPEDEPESFKPTREELKAQELPDWSHATPPRLPPPPTRAEIEAAKTDADLKARSMADTMESIRLNTNPAEEAARAANASEEASRFAFMPPDRPGGTAVIFARNEPQTPQAENQKAGDQKSPEKNPPEEQNSTEKKAARQDVTTENAANLDDEQLDKAVESQEKENAQKEGDPDAPRSRAEVEGKGVLISDDSIESGDFHDGKLEGRGEEVSRDGTMREGDYQDGKLEGPGKETGAEDGKGYVRTGTFKDDEFDGEVRVVWQGGSSRKELWRGGYKVAEGPLAPPGQNPVLPEKYLHMTPEQLAEATFSPSDVLIDARYVDGKLDGVLERIRADGSAQFEEWENGHLVQLGVRGAKGDVIAPQQRPKPAPRMAAYIPPPQMNALRFEPQAAPPPNPCRALELKWTSHNTDLGERAAYEAFDTKKLFMGEAPGVLAETAGLRSQGKDWTKDPEVLNRFMAKARQDVQRYNREVAQGNKAFEAPAAENDWLICMGEKFTRELQKPAPP